MALKNPLVIEANAGWGGVLSLIENRKSIKAKVVTALKSGKYDGLIARDLNPNADGEPDTIVVALRPEQIKSVTSNIGLYDKDCADMTDRSSPLNIANVAMFAEQALTLVAKATASELFRDKQKSRLQAPI